MDSWDSWVKTFHIIAVISWMAGMLYLPRLFVYHSQYSNNSNEIAVFKVMERRLFKAIMTPALIAVWISGPIVAYAYNEFHSLWLYAKLSLVILLTLFHFYLGKILKLFATDANTHSTRFYRILNEVPTLLMVLIVTLVVVKPF
jgi:putative membrane protein